MKRIICLLVSALLLSCAPVNNTSVPVGDIKTSNADKKQVLTNSNVSAEPELNSTVNTEVKKDIVIETSSSPVNKDIKDPRYASTGVEKSIETLPSPSLTNAPTIAPQSSSNNYYPSELPSPSPTVPCRGGTTSNSSVIVCETPTPAPSKVSYSISYPVEDIPGGYYRLTFKDEYRVRYDQQNKHLYSLNNSDLKSINELLISDNISIVPVNNGTYVYTEEEMDVQENSYQADGHYIDYIHLGSQYYLSTKNVSIPEFVNKVRANDLVREFNYFPPKMVTND